MAGFDVEAARQEGYSDAEIAQHLLDINDVDREGASDAEVISTLAPISAAPIVEDQAPVSEEQYSVQDPLGAGILIGGLYQAGNLASRPFHKTAPQAAPKATPQANPSEMLVIPKDLPTTEFPSPELAVAEAAQNELAGHEKWNKKLTGQNLPGSQMDAESLARNREHAYNVNKALSEGPLAGGMQTESGLLVDAKERARIEQQAREMELEAARQAARDKLAREELSAAAKKEAGRAWLAKQGAENALFDFNNPASKKGPSTAVRINEKTPNAFKVGVGAYNAQDAWNNYVQGNPVRAGISATGGLAPIITSLSKNPKTRAVGAGLSLAAPALNRAIDYFYPPEKKSEGGGVKGRGKYGVIADLAEPVLSKLSEVLAPHKDKYLGITQSDNFGAFGDRMGGIRFPEFQNVSPRHAEDRVIWMNDTENHANAMANKSTINGKPVVWTTYTGRPDQLKTNKSVWEDIMENHYGRDLSPEQIDLINHRIATIKDNNGNLIFPQPFDIRDRFATMELGGDTFARRGALGDIVGTGVGKTKVGRQIALPNYEDILASHREPLTIGQPTSSVGSNLFTVDPTLSKFSREYHPDFNWTVHGENLNTPFEMTPHEFAARDWYNRQLEKTGKVPHGNSWFNYMKDPQYISEDFLKWLKDQGYAKGGKVNYGPRIDFHPKESGFLGEIRSPNGRDVMTEVSVGTPWSDETFRPTLVPGIHPADLNYLRETGNPPLDLINASLPNARRRIEAGKSPFWNAAQDSKYAEGGKTKPFHLSTGAIEDLLGGYISPDQFPAAFKADMTNFPKQDKKKSMQEAMDMALNFGPMGVGHVLPGLLGTVKNVGGNWLPRTQKDIEYTLGRLSRTREPGQTMPVFTDTDKALNNWASTTGRKYMLNRMGSPEDEIKKLYDQGIMHMTPEEIARRSEEFYQHGDSLDREQLNAKRNRLGFPSAGGNPYENIVDAAINSTDAKFWQTPKSYDPQPDWMLKLDPESKVYRESSYVRLPFVAGMDNLTKTLEKDIAAGKLRPEQLNKVSIEEAVRRAHQQRVETEAAIEKASQTLPKVRDYPTGFSWTDLTHEDPTALDAILKKEGNTMQNCIGGYCSNVLEDGTKLYSLRDPAGNPHVNIEVKRGPKGDVVSQVKGKQNEAPVEYYLPYVQDFITNPIGGEPFKMVGDLENTGLHDVAKLKQHGLYDLDEQPGVFKELERIFPNEINNYGAKVLSGQHGLRIPTYDMLKQSVQDIPGSYISSEDLVNHLRQQPARPVEHGYSNYYENNPDALNWQQYAGGGRIEMGEALGKAALNAVKKFLPETKPAVNRVDMNFKDVTKRVPELTEAANKLAKGEMTASEYDALVNSVKPVTPYTFVPQPATTEDAMRALTKNKQPMYGKTTDIGPGEQTDLRLDIPAYRDHGVWINSIHRNGAPTVYGPVSSVKNATMIGAPDKALKVAQGTTPKAPFAVIRGEWNPVEQDAAVANAQEYLNHPDWAQVGYDPERHGYFYNRSTMEPIQSAEEVLQIGPLVLAKKPVHAAKSDQLFSHGGAVNGLDYIS